MSRRRRRRNPSRKSKGKIDPLLLIALAVGGYFLYTNASGASAATTVNTSSGGTDFGVNDPSSW